MQQCSNRNLCWCFPEKWHKIKFAVTELKIKSARAQYFDKADTYIK